MTDDTTLDAQFWAWWFSMSQSEREYIEGSVC